MSCLPFQRIRMHYILSLCIKIILRIKGIISLSLITQLELAEKAKGKTLIISYTKPKRKYHPSIT